MVRGVCAQDTLAPQRDGLRLEHLVLLPRPTSPGRHIAHQQVLGPAKTLARSGNKVFTSQQFTIRVLKLDAQGRQERSPNRHLHLGQLSARRSHSKFHLGRDSAYSRSELSREHASHKSIRRRSKRQSLLLRRTPASSKPRIPQPSTSGQSLYECLISQWSIGMVNLTAPLGTDASRRRSARPATRPEP